MWARAFARRRGACLALAALMLQLALSFAHVHKHDLAFVSFARADIVSVGHARSGLVAERLPARLADDDENCPICFSAFLLSNSSLPDASAKLHSQDFAAVERPLGPVFDQVFLSRHTAFLSRGPPGA